MSKQRRYFHVGVAVFHLQGDGVQREVPHVPDGVVQGLLDTPQLGGVLLQKLAVVLQLNLCVYFCTMEGLIEDTSAVHSLLFVVAKISQKGKTLFIDYEK